MGVFGGEVGEGESEDDRREPMDKKTEALLLGSTEIVE